MPDPLETETEISFKEPVRVIIETNKNDKSSSGLSATTIDFWKWIIGTVILGLAGNVISCRHNDTKLELERMEADSKLISAVSAKFDTLPSVQLSYMKYIKPFITTPALIAGIDQNIDSLIFAVHSQIKDSRNEVTTAKQEAFKAYTPKQIDQLKQEANADTSKGSKPATTSMNEEIHQEDKILEKNTNLITPIETKAISNIDAAYNILTPKTDSAYTLSGNPQTLWCKKGYYVEFNNTLRIGINDLIIGDQKIIVNARDIETDTDDPPLIKDDIVIKSGQTITQDWKKTYRYLITLNYIGAAGKNPFTKAAYITVATYKKN
jgi:hypothetical protein